MAKKNKASATNYSREAIGVILIGIGILLLLAILSYNRTDNPQLNVADNALKIKNWLGPLGAAFASPLMNFTLGYPVAVFPLMIIYAGIHYFRNTLNSARIRPLLMQLMWAVVLSMLLALPEALEQHGHIREYFPSGKIGGEMAGKLVLYTGNFGAIFLMTVIVLSLAIFSLRLQLNMIVTTIADGIATLRDNALRAWADFQKERARARKIAEEKKRNAEREAAAARELEIRTARETERARTNTPIPQPEPEVEAEVAEPDISIGETEPQVEEDEFEDISDLGEEMMSTTLDDLLHESGGDAVSTGILKKAGTSYEAEGIDEPTQRELDFEVQEEAKVEEVDYDQMVRESIARYQFPSVDFLDEPPLEDTTVTRDELKSNAALLESKLMDFGIKVKVIRVTAGPVITLYELQPAPGVKVSSIVSLANDLAMAMEAKGLRMVAPIPGKAAIGIEIPNRNPQVVYLKSLIRSEAYAQSKAKLPLALGKTINGEVYVADLAKMPHLLIAGSTGSGKSVGINTIIASLLYKIDPGKLKFAMVDPKKIELSVYRPIRDQFLVWRTDLDEEVVTRPSNAVSLLNSMVMEMEQRYDKLAHLGVRSLDEYNDRVRMGGPRIKEEKLQQLPYIVVIIDELADLMMVAAKEVEAPIARLAQMARAVGIHLILATQRPSVDVITGVIKANFPARIAYMVTTRADSKTILDGSGADQLLGNGDMLYQPPGEPRAIRLQNPLITTNEVERIIKHLRKQPKLPHYGLPQPAGNSAAGIGGGDGGGGQDNLYDQARRIVVQHQQGSISLLQRRLKIGYSRAARLMDEMEEEGVVGPPDGAKPRAVYLQPEDL
jgi:S-DNA-T family DNA segregation ATPase FtsK/SpoIIIE